MSLNSAIVSRGNPFNRELMELDSGEPMEVDSISSFSELPIDVIQIIFQNLKTDLPNLALVCRNWKNISDDKGFREMIRPVQAFGTKEWQEYIGVDAGAELRLPRCVYGDLEWWGDGLLTFIPDKVKVTKENGGVEEVLLDNLEVIGKLVGNPKKGNKTGYDNMGSLQELILEKRKLEKPHWVWIKKKVIGRSINYLSQKNILRTIGANVSGLIDTAVSVFMVYVSSGERNFVWDPPVNGDKTFVRVKEQYVVQHDVNGIWLGFTPSGLLVDLALDHHAHCYAAVAPARRSFGQC